MSQHVMNYIESDVAAELTLAEWRRARVRPRPRRRLKLRIFIPARRPALGV
jgi:hypothetical protein